MKFTSVPNRDNILTEQNNPKSVDLDTLSTLEIVKLFSEEDKIPQKAISRAIPSIVNAIDCISARINKGGRLFYLGTGTSGRLGVLDASELPPTFCVSPQLVQGIIAGGNNSLRESSEGLEDSSSLAIRDLKDRSFTKDDCLVGISAGGTTPYVLSGLNFSKEIKALTISITCVPKSDIEIPSDIDIRLLTGPELLTGSTRLKAGTATKMALNIISTTVMVRLGKVYGNHMIDVSVTNNKLLDRALRILEEVGKINRDDALNLLELTNGSVKLSLLIGVSKISLEKAKELLVECDQELRQALKKI